jgi:hypothetical protein
MVRDFTAAKRTLCTSNTKMMVVAVNGCYYGRDDNPHKNEDYFKYCGQAFWHFISGSPNLYIDLIAPLAYKVQEKNKDFMQMYGCKLNLFALEFVEDFCCNSTGKIDWDTFLQFNSAAKKM